MPRSPVPSNIRCTRSGWAAAVVAVLLMATFTPVQWLRGRLPRWSSPSRSLARWAEPADSLSIQLQAILWEMQNLNISTQQMTRGDQDRIKLLLDSASEDKPADPRWEEQPPAE
jgi:hypothetical protein